MNAFPWPTGWRLSTLRQDKSYVRSDAKPSNLGAHYYAEVGDGGPRLFDLESKIALGTEKFIIRFSNVAANGQGMVLDWKSAAFSKRGELYLNGVMVSGFERELFKVKGEYDIHVAPGMDKLLAVSVMACVHDRRASQRSSGTTAMAASTS